ncbi:MAG: glucose PTS transporter subunit IIA [Propioniciclava sp.]
MKYETLVTGVIDNIGGADNLQLADHCATRMRLAVKDPAKLNEEALKAIPGVLGVRSLNENEVQVIVGTDVLNVYQEFVTTANYSGPAGGTVPAKAQARPTTVGGWSKYVGNGILSYLSGAVRPVIPIYLTSGLLLAFLTVLTTFFGVSDSGGTFVVLNAAAMAGFTFAPVALGWSAANTLKVEPALGALLGMILVYPEISGATGLSFMGISVHSMSYTGSFLPIVLSVPLLAVVYTFLRDKIPQAIRYFMLPLLTMLIVIPVTLIVLGPISDWIGSGFAVALNWLGEHFRFGASALWAAFCPIGIITGIDKAVLFGFEMPIMLEKGYDDLFFPGALAGNSAIGGAALAVFFLSRSVNTKSIASSSGVTAVLGITEPALYGVLLPFRKPMIGAMAGAAVGGVFGAIFDLKQYQPVGPGLMTSAVYISPDGDMGNFSVALATIAVAAIAGFAFTFGLSARDRKRYTDDAVTTGTPATPQAPVATVEATPEPLAAGGGTSLLVRSEVLRLAAPVSGSVVALSEVSDPMFAAGKLGPGIGIRPSSGELRAPVDGEVVMTMPHAYGMRADDGTEVLIHVGIDTNTLKGDGFTQAVATGDRVTAGDLLGTVDLASIAAHGLDPTVLMVLTRTAENEPLEVAGTAVVTAGDPLITLGNS